MPVSVSVAASANPVYSNTPVTYTATPTNGGDIPHYQWKVNGVNVGSNSATFIYTPQQGDSVSCTLTSSLQCVTNNPASSFVKMVVIQRTNYWYGYISTDWGNPANWTGNYVPAPGEDVEYATLENTPDSATFAVRDLWLDQNRTIGSLINATIRRLVIPAGKGLTVNNTITTDGSVDRIYIYSRTHSTEVPNGSLSFKNPYEMPVSATVEMYSKAFWNLDEDKGNKYKWQYFGIPLRSVKAEPTFNGSYVRKWYETGTTIANHWIQLGNQSILDPFYGYELCHESAKTIYFRGQLVNHDFRSGKLAYTSEELNPGQGALYPGQHVFANPYTAAIDIRQLHFGPQTEASVYMYNTGSYNQWLPIGQSTPGNNPGQYTSVPKENAGYLQIPRQCHPCKLCW